MKIRSISFLVPAALLLSLSAQGQSNQQITTTDGRTYNQVQVLRVEPDGLVVQYQPEQPGIGMAKLKFRNLPDAVRNQYGYDAQRAADFETQEAQATTQWRTRTSPADQAIQRYRWLAEWNRALAGDALSSYSVSMDNNGKVSAQGFTGNVVPYLYDYGLVYPGSYTAMPATQGTTEAKPTISPQGNGY